MTTRETLEWAARNEVVIEIVQEGTAARASSGRLFAEYPIDMANPNGLGDAVGAALESVKAGAEFHSVHGYTPGLNLGEGPSRAG